METKLCKKCGLPKPLNEFGSQKRTFDGLRSFCKECQSSYMKNYRKNNKVKIKETYKKYCIENSDNIRKHQQNYSKEYYIKHSNEIIEKSKKYYNENKVHRKIIIKFWKLKNKDRVTNYNLEYLNQRKHIGLWRRLLHRTLKYFNTKKENTTINSLGYSAIQLKDHIEKQFTEGMSWNNYGKWHVDHIKPLSSFSTDTPPNVVNALTNLQPLWAEDNLKKWCKY